MSETIFQGLGQVIQITRGDALGCYKEWPTPVVIVSDGPYGVKGFRGDPPIPDHLDEWYTPHIREWTEKATPQTTLWFWNTEVGWATIHPVLIHYGWEYKACCIWNKGIAHIAGNSNTQSLSKLPIVTEVCVQYVKKPMFCIDGKMVEMKIWLRHEWKRSGLPFRKANDAAGVVDAATRKYLTQCHLWYYPPPEAFAAISRYANEHGDPSGRPYFSIDGREPLDIESYSRLRAKFSCPIGITNVWDEPPLNGTERVRNGSRALHLNQKPLRLMRLIIDASSDPGDVVWEPFGGLFSATAAAHDLGRSCYAAEINEDVYGVGKKRLLDHMAALRMDI